MLTKNKKNPGPKVIAFGLVRRDKDFVPTRFEIVDGEVVKESQIAPAGPYEGIAHQYLASRIMEFYVNPKRDV